MQQIPNIVKIEDNDCNSLTVEVDSDASDKNIEKKMKTNLNEKENNQMRKLKNVKKRKKTSKVILRLIQKK